MVGVRAEGKFQLSPRLALFRGTKKPHGIDGRPHLQDPLFGFSQCRKLSVIVDDLVKSGGTISGLRSGLHRRRRFSELIGDDHERKHAPLMARMIAMSGRFSPARIAGRRRRAKTAALGTSVLERESCRHWPVLSSISTSFARCSYSAAAANSRSRVTSSLTPPASRRALAASLRSLDGSVSMFEQ